MSTLPFYVYILRSSKDNQFYVGFTTDLQQRLTEHFHGTVQSTAPRRPLQLIHCEYFQARADAVRRERYLKTTAGKRMLKLMLSDTLKTIP